MKSLNKSYNLLFLLGMLALCFIYLIFSGYDFVSREKEAEVYKNNSSAQAAILMEVSSGRILYQKNHALKLPMASCTKILTALTVIEHCDIKSEVEVDARAVGVEGSSIYLRKGEHLTVEELLYGLMLQSGNDCAVALAIFVGGSVENFAQMMNDTAQSLGAKNSNFVNPHGLHDDNHYTTAYDLGLIACKALQNEEFAKIVSTRSVTISNEGQDYRRTIINKNKLLSKFEFADGVKTGYTKKAGRCFVGSATKNGMQLVAVVLNCGPMFEESKLLLEYGFENYYLKAIYQKNKIFSVRSGRQNLLFRLDEGYSYPLKKDGSEDGKINTEKCLKGDKLLNLEITFANRLIFSRQLSIIKGSE